MQTVLRWSCFACLLMSLAAWGAETALPVVGVPIRAFNWIPARGNGGANAVAFDSAGNVIMGGYLTQLNPAEETVALVSKWSPDDGTIYWSREWESGPIDPDLPDGANGKHSSSELFTCIGVDADDNVYAGGRFSGVWSGHVDGSYIHGMGLRRYLADGTLDWEQVYHDTANSAWQWFTGLDVDPFGRAYITGPSMGNWAEAQYRWTTLAYDPYGNIVLGPIQHNHSLSFDYKDIAYDVALIPGAGFITVGQIGISGTSGGTTNDYDWHVRFSNADGTTIRSHTYAGAAHLHDVARGVCVVPGVSAFVVGYTNRGTDNADGRDLDGRVYRYTLQGIPELDWVVGGAGANEVLIDVTAEGQEYVYVVGYVTDGEGATQGLLQKYAVTSPNPVAEQIFPIFSTINSVAVQNSRIALAGSAYQPDDTLSFYTLVLDMGGGEGEGEGECDGWCADETADTDGDGLTDCEECTLHGTDPESSDTDTDGMPDGYEVTAGLDPTVHDADEDPDADSLTNLDEFFRGSDPLDSQSPEAVYYVAAAGENIGTGGTIDAPWATISYALEEVSPTAASPVRIVLNTDVYNEDVTLIPYVTLSGTPGALPLITGFVTGANHSTLEYVEITPPGTGGTIITAPDATMTLRGLNIRGGAYRDMTGLVTSGTGAAATLIEACTFQSLGVGMRIESDLPILRRTRFTDIANVAIVVAAWPVKSEGSTLSAADDPTRGYNSFDLESGVLAVENNRDETLVMENTDWGVDTATEVQALLGGTGPVDFEPFLPKGTAVLVSSLLCTVWDGATQARILDATVQISGGLRPVTENENGVYAFPVVTPGAYTLTVNAPGYPEETFGLALAEGGASAVGVPMGLDGGDTPKPGACAASTAPSGRGHLGTLAVAMAMVTALLLLRRRRTTN